MYTTRWASPNRRHFTLFCYESYLYSHIKYFRIAVFCTNCTNIIIVDDLSAVLCRFCIAVKIYDEID